MMMWGGKGGGHVRYGVLNTSGGSTVGMIVSVVEVKQRRLFRP